MRLKSISRQNSSRNFHISEIMTNQNFSTNFRTGNALKRRIILGLATHALLSART